MKQIQAKDIKPGMTLMYNGKVREVAFILRNKEGKLVARMSREGDRIVFINDSAEITLIGSK